MFDRSQEHHQNLIARKPNSALNKHWQTDHPELTEAPNFKHSLVKTFKTSTERQVYEAVMIDSVKCQNILNSKAEYRHNALVRRSIVFREELWKPDDPSLAENHCQNEQKPLGQPTLTSGEEQNTFGSQYKQRKRKAKQDASNSQNILSIPPDSDKSTRSEPNTQAIFSQSLGPQGNDESEPKTHSNRVQVCIKGKVISSLKPIAKKRRTK